MLPIIIEGVENGAKARVTPSGELVVRSYGYDLTEFNELTVINTAYNYYEPVAGKQFLITSVVVFANKDISDATDTIIEIYEASDADTITADKTLLKFGMGKLTSLPIVPLNLLINEGKWVNAKTDDNSIFMTIIGHYIDKEI